MSLVAGIKMMAECDMDRLGVHFVFLSVLLLMFILLPPVKAINLTAQATASYPIGLLL
jgi:hypothetical protein